MVWQELNLVHVEKPERDLLVLTGPEPDHRWKQFASSVTECAAHFGIVQSIALGALPAAVPHTRPVPLIATATPQSLLTPEDRRPQGLLRVPAAALSVLQMALSEQGVPVSGFFVQIPHYVSPVYWPGVATLVGRLGRQVGIELALGSIEEEAAQQRVQLDEIVASRPDVRQHVEQLESMTPEEDLAA